MRIKRLRHEVHLEESLGDRVPRTKLSYYPRFLSFHTSVLGTGTRLG